MSKHKLLKISTYNIQQKTKDWLDDNVEDWQNLRREAIQYYRVISPGKIVIVPTPSVTIIQGMAVELILKPTFDAETLPDIIYDDYADGIAIGAKSRLMLMPNKKWSNLKLGAYFKGEFEKVIADAKSKARSGYRTENRKTRSKPHFF